jgi:hypothetical protein
LLFYLLGVSNQKNIRNHQQIHQAVTRQQGGGDVAPKSGGSQRERQQISCFFSQNAFKISAKNLGSDLPKTYHAELWQIWRPPNGLQHAQTLEANRSSTQLGHSSVKNHRTPPFWGQNTIFFLYHEII